MAITVNQFLNLDHYDVLAESLGSIALRLEAAREKMIARGIPVTGKLAENFEKFQNCINDLLNDSPEDEVVAKQEAALRTMDDFAAFMNLNIGPGQQTLRDLLTNGKEDDRTALENELSELEEGLQIETEKNIAPLYNFRTQNETDEFTSEMLEEQIQSHLSRGQYEPNNTAFNDYENAVRDLMYEFDQHQHEDPKAAEEAAQELDHWSVLTGFTTSSKNVSSQAIRFVTINGEEKCFKTAPMQRGEALQKFCSDFEKVNGKKLTIGKETHTVEEWLNKVAKKPVVQNLRDEMNPALYKPNRNELPISADQLIESVTTPLKNGAKEPAFDDLCAVFAARTEANAERDNIDGLKAAKISKGKVDFVKGSFAKNHLVQEYFEQNGAEVKRLIKKGHGGELEESFKKFLLNQPAGKLENDPALQRYMPTYSQRIKALQKKAKTLQGNESLETMAEITILRNMAKTQRKKKARLEKTIACDASLSLSKSVDILANKTAFNRLAVEALGDLQSGHGGAMVDTMRRAARTLKPDEYDDITNVFINRNTYGGLISNIKVQAGLMLDKLVNNPGAAASMKEEYRKMAFELHGLCDSVKNLGSKRLPLGSNVDWDHMDYIEKTLSEGNHFSPEKTADVTVEQMKYGLERMMQTDLKTLNFNMASAYPKKNPAAEHDKEIQNINRKENEEINIIPKV